MLKDNIFNMGNHWVDLLIKRITSDSLELTTLLVQETDEWKAKLSQNNQKEISNDLMVNYQLLCRRLERMINELEDYILKS